MCQCEFYNTVRNTTGHRTRRSCPKGGSVAKKTHELITVVYYESIKREVKTKHIYECLCYERPKHKDEESTRLVYTGVYDKTN